MGVMVGLLDIEEALVSLNVTRFSVRFNQPKDTVVSWHLGIVNELILRILDFIVLFFFVEHLIDEALLVSFLNVLHSHDFLLLILDCETLPDSALCTLGANYMYVAFTIN